MLVEYVFRRLSGAEDDADGAHAGDDDGHAEECASGSELWYIGVVLIALGSVGINLGNNLMSLGHAQHEGKEDDAPAGRTRKSLSTPGVRCAL